MTLLFDGAAAVASQELGMEVATRADAERFREWASRRDAHEDVRMMVPIFYDIDRGKTKVWTILGWATRVLEVSFAKPPKVHIINGRPRIVFGSAFRRIAYPVFAEAYVSRLLDRDEFRAHCDRYRTRTEILNICNGKTLSVPPKPILHVPTKGPRLLSEQRYMRRAGSARRSHLSAGRRRGD